MHSLDVFYEAAAEFHSMYYSQNVKVVRTSGYHRCLFLYAGSQPLTESRDGNVASAIN